jgi:hypothetical protein
MKGIPQPQILIILEIIVEESGFKSIFIDGMKSLKHKDATSNPLELTHIRIWLNSTEDNSRIMHLTKLYYVPTFVERYERRTTSSALPLSTAWPCSEILCRKIAMCRMHRTSSARECRFL